MTKYRKKPVVVEAMQFTVETKDQVFNFVRCNACAEFENGRPVMIIQTVHGDNAIVRPGDWVIREPEGGGYYPCKPDIFEATYEPEGGK